MGIQEHISIGTVVQYSLAVVALVWVFSTVNWHQMFRLTQSLSPILVLAVLAISAIGVFPHVWMWSVLLSRFEAVDPCSVLQADLVIKFVNTLFPSRIIGRSIAPLSLHYFTGIGWTESTAVVGAHTGLYALCYALIGLGGVTLLYSKLSVGVSLLVGISITVYLVVGILIVLGGSRMDQFEPVMLRFSKSADKIPVIGAKIASLVSGVSGVIAESATGFQAILADRRAVLRYGVAWVLGLAVLPGLRVYLLFVGFGTPPETPWLLPLYLVTAYAVTILPLTPGGIGVAEATSTVVFVGLGYPTAVVVPVILFDRTLGVYLPALAGWYPTATADLDELVADVK